MCVNEKKCVQNVRRNVCQHPSIHMPRLRGRACSHERRHLCSHEQISGTHEGTNRHRQPRTDQGTGSVPNKCKQKCRRNTRERRVSLSYVCVVMNAQPKTHKARVSNRIKTKQPRGGWTGRILPNYIVVAYIVMASWWMDGSCRTI